MNIFVVDSDPVVAARSLCDQHVCKMVLETAQMMSTIAGGPYKSTHAFHPCVMWLRASRSNLRWALMHGSALACEYTRRFGREHASAKILAGAGMLALDMVPDTAATEFVQCMPDAYRGPDAVEAYRRYYRTKQFARWRYSVAPEWFFS